VSTFQPAEETLLEQREDGETNTHEGGTSQKMAYALMVLIKVNYLPCNGNLSGTKNVRLLASPEILKFTFLYDGTTYIKKSIIWKTSLILVYPFRGFHCIRSGSGLRGSRICVAESQGD